MTWAQPVTLQLTAQDEARLGPAVVRLEPLELRHAADLTVAGTADTDTWTLLPVPAPRTEADITAIIRTALDKQATLGDVPFAVVRLADGRAVGSTRYLEVQPANRSLEIGWTWYGPAARRTRINTECKLLLMRHAFDTLGCVRVQLRTDGRNQRSQLAMMRIGASYEGTLRKHRVNPDGYIRDTVFFGVIAEQWPAVRERMEWLLTRERRA